MPNPEGIPHRSRIPSVKAYGRRVLWGAYVSRGRAIRVPSFVCEEGNVLNVLLYRYIDIDIYLYIYMHLRYTSVLHVYMHVYHMHTWCPQNPEESVRSLGIGTMNGPETPYGPLQEQKVAHH